MKQWHKIGRIFNPDDWYLGEEIIGFAQGPQALVFNEFVRIYFSSRKISNNGKFISVIRYIEIDRTFKKILKVSSGQVISDGTLGAYDEHGIFPLNIARVKNKIYGYICGWSRRQTVSIDMAIGLSESLDNGKTFLRKGIGPILTASMKEPFLIGDPFVAEFEGTFHMWYIFGTEWKRQKNIAITQEPDRIYKIGHAISVDGINWAKGDGGEVIANYLSADECQAMPSVVKIDGSYHMFFCYRHVFDFRKNSKNSYRIGHAISDDLFTWSRDNSYLVEPSSFGWDSEMVCYPHVFNCDNSIYMLYNGNDFGRHGFGIANLI